MKELFSNRRMFWFCLLNFALPLEDLMSSRGEGVDGCFEDQVVEGGEDGTGVEDGGHELAGVVETVDTGIEEEGVVDTIVDDG